MNLVELKKRLAHFGFTPKRSLGQNFLVSDTVIERIISKVEFFQPDQVLEIGPGIGALTDHLLEVFGEKLQVIELDTQLAEHWRSQNLKVTEQDALQLDWEEFCKEHRDKKLILVSNLPYQISSSLVVELSSLKGPTFKAMVLMFQKEVAERIMAKPKTKDYGILTVVAQNTWKIAKVVDASARCFYPAPKISSRVLSFELKDDAYSDPGFLSFVKVGFQNRRKLLSKSLAALSTPPNWDWLSVFHEMGWDKNIRAEEVSVIEWRKLHQTYRKAMMGDIE